MSPTISAASAVPVAAPTLASGPSRQMDASGGNSSPFGQALSEAQTSDTRGSANAHRPRSVARGDSLPPDGNPTPPANAVPAAVPVAVPAPVVLPVPAQSLAASVAPIIARGDRALAATAAVSAAATPRTGPALPVSGSHDAAPALPAVTADVQGTPSSPEVAAVPVTAAAAASDANAAATAAADAAAVALERPAEVRPPATSVTGRSAAAPQPNTFAGAPAAGGNADSQAASTAPISGSMQPVFALQAGAGRHGDAAAGSGAAVPAVDASAAGAAGAAGVNGIAAAQGAATAPAVALPVPQPTSPHFPDQLAAHVSWLVDSNLNGATLQVSPPQLGPIEMRVSVEAGHAQVWLSAHSAATVDALQHSSSRLRDMLASQGFGQVSVDVSQRSFQDRSGSAPTYAWGGVDATLVQAGAAPVQAALQRASSGALDAYA